MFHCLMFVTGTLGHRAGSLLLSTLGVCFIDLCEILMPSDEVTLGDFISEELYARFSEEIMSWALLLVSFLTLLLDLAPVSAPKHPHLLDPAQKHVAFQTQPPFPCIPNARRGHRAMIHFLERECGQHCLPWIHMGS